MSWWWWYVAWHLTFIMRHTHIVPFASNLTWVLQLKTARYKMTTTQIQKLEIRCTIKVANYYPFLTQLFGLSWFYLGFTILFFLNHSNRTFPELNLRVVQKHGNDDFIFLFLFNVYLSLNYCRALVHSNAKGECVVLVDGLSGARFFNLKKFKFRSFKKIQKNTWL
jgi:hypothetical protein